MTDLYEGYRLDGYLMEDSGVDAPELLASTSQPVPSMVDLRSQCSPVENQGKLGSCTANAAVGALEYHQICSGAQLTDLSRLFLYYTGRKLKGTELEDKGLSIHHAMAAIMAYGVCPENMWPYMKPMYTVRPTDACYSAALDFTGIQYAKIKYGNEMKVALAAGIPVVFGMGLSWDFFRPAAKTGRIDVPTNGWPEPVGGHAMLIVGYNDSEKIWIVRNSWGTRFGDGGHVHIHYEVMEHYIRASWTIGALSRPESGLRLAGVSMEASQSALMAKTPRPPLHSTAHPHDAAIPSQLRAKLDDAKKGFRSRLRDK